MPTPSELIQRLTNLVRRRNGELARDAALKMALGLIFGVLTFGFIFWIGWLVGFFVAHNLSLQPWQFAAMLTGVFLIAAIGSAWYRVNPLAGLHRMTDREWLLTQISLASPNLVYFSPRHASAGFALVLLGGPAGVFEALGIWAHRLRADKSQLEEACRMLASCEDGLPTDKLREPASALLLRRLSLIKVIPRGNGTVLALTEKGLTLLSGGQARKGKGASRPAK